MKSLLFSLCNPSKTFLDHTKVCDLKDPYSAVGICAGAGEFAHVLQFGDEINLSWQAGYPYKFVIFCSDRALCVLSLIAADLTEPVTSKLECVRGQTENKKIDSGRGGEGERRETECRRGKRRTNNVWNRADSNGLQIRYKVFKNHFYGFSLGMWVLKMKWFYINKLAFMHSLEKKKKKKKWHKGHFYIAK